MLVNEVKRERIYVEISAPFFIIIVNFNFYTLFRNSAELYEKIERYREYIWKSPEQIEFVEKIFKSIYLNRLKNRSKWNISNKILNF